MMLVKALLTFLKPRVAHFPVLSWVSTISQASSSVWKRGTSQTAFFPFRIEASMTAAWGFHDVEQMTQSRSSSAQRRSKSVRLRP